MLSAAAWLANLGRGLDVVEKITRKERRRREREREAAARAPHLMRDAHSREIRERTYRESTEWAKADAVACTQRSALGFRTLAWWTAPPPSIVSHSPQSRRP